MLIERTNHMFFRIDEKVEDDVFPIAQKIIRKY